jgi:hypothetical protein
MYLMSNNEPLMKFLFLRNRIFSTKRERERERERQREKKRLDPRPNLAGRFRSPFPINKQEY